MLCYAHARTHAQTQFAPEVGFTFEITVLIKVLLFCVLLLRILLLIFVFVCPQALFLYMD